MPPVAAPFLLLLSGPTEGALRDEAARLRAFLASAEGAALPIGDIAYTAAGAVTAAGHHHAHRLAAMGSSAAEWSSHLGAFLAGQRRHALSTGVAEHGQRPLAFVFNGMGTQWWAMGRELLAREPAFRAALEEVDDLFVQIAGWSIARELRAEEDRTRVDWTEVAQPAIFAVQIALTRLWRAWGVTPSMVVGHSLGEAAAAEVAGALSLRDAVALMFHRSRLQALAAGEGTMLAVALSASQVAPFLSGSISLGAANSPRGTTLAGPRAELEEIRRTLQRQGLFARFLNVDVPYHSPAMDPLREEMVRSLSWLRPRPAEIPMVSTVLGERIDGRELDGEYWFRNLREPVRFVQAVDLIIDAGCEAFLEIGAQPALVTSLTECLAARQKAGLAVPSIRRAKPEWPALLASAGRLYAAGVAVDWGRVFRSGHKKKRGGVFRHRPAFS
jgi:acyl transferase domain-containing protein